MKTRIVKLFVAIFLMVVSANLSADTLRVNHTSTATGPDGSTWALAYQDLQAALFFATTGDEIWIAKGTYHPTSGVDRDAHFDISEGLSIYGNFNGTENALADRDMTGVLDLNQTRTVLSGEIHDLTTTNDNSKVIVRFASQGGSGRISILDGITIEDARGHGFSCILDDDTPDRGVYINNVLFNNNDARASFPSFDYGGAIKILGQTGVTVNNSRFIANKANYGSAIYRQGQARINMSNCVFEYNIAQVHGTVHNVSLNIGSVMSIENCSFTNNTNQNTASNYPSCVSIWGIGSLINVSNSIFWGNGSNTTPLEIGGYADVNVRNSIVQGGFTGPTQTSVQDIDPNWISPELNLSRNSPAIDVGDNSLYNSTSLIDIDGDVRIQDGTIDLGAQETSDIDPNDFVLTLSGSTVTIPTQASNPIYNYDYTVDWGDGTSNLSQTGDITHVYNQPTDPNPSGPHQVIISGQFPTIYYNNGAHAAELQSIDQWGTGQWATMDRAFRGCSNMISNATDAPDLSICTVIQGAFMGCTLFNGDLNNWDVSTITNMRSLFYQAHAFNKSLSNWNVSNVTKMNGMFRDAFAFNQDLGSWNIGKVTNMNNMLNGTHLSEANYDATLGGWLVTYNSNPIAPAQQLISLGAAGVKFCDPIHRNNLISAGLTTITDAGQEIHCAAPSDYFMITVTNPPSTTGAYSFTIPTNPAESYIYFVDWGDNTIATSETGDASHNYTSSGPHQIKIIGDFPAIYFNDQTSAVQLQSIDQWGVGQWRTMNYSFYGCSNMVYNASDIPNLTSVTSAHSMFSDCSMFDGDLTDWNVSSVSLMRAMFTGASSFTGIGLDTWERNNAGIISTLNNVYNLMDMFRDATNFNADISDWNITQITSLQRTFFGASSFNRSLNWDFSNVTNMVESFASATSFDQDISTWDVSSVQSTPGMFYQASSYNNGGVALNWGDNTSNFVSIQSMFREASSFNQDISSWNVSSVNSLAQLFRDATTYNNGGVSLNNWERNVAGNSASTIANVTSMENTFDGAGSFNQLINAWDVSGVTNMNSAFESAAQFNQPLNQWGAKLNAVTTMVSMFNNAVLFNQDLNSWDVSNVTNMFRMFLQASAFDGDISSWQSSSVTSMQNMFFHAISFNQDVSGWPVTSVTAIKNMFQGATLFDQNLGSWNIISINSMDGTLDNSGLSECNYDATLTGWDSQIISSTNALDLGASGVSFGDDAAKLRLIGNGWMISDGGQGTVCPTSIARKKASTSILDVVDSELKFYPNPTSNSFTINGFEENVQVTLMDIRGKVVLQTSAFSNTSIDVNSLAKGVYILHAIDASKNQIYDNLIIQ
ncbi:MAG: surface protein [Vicingaceae bacterium]|jgi:surface protein